MKYNPYSFSKISQFQQCPYKWKLNYIDKLGKWENTLATERGSYVHLMLEKNSEDVKFNFHLMKDSDISECKFIFRQVKNSPFGKLVDHQKAEAEVEFAIKKEDGKIVACDYRDKQAIFRGKIDYFLKLGDEVLILDWKTGKENPFPATLQVKMYAVWTFIKYPEIKTVKTGFVYVEHLKMKKYNFEREELNNLIKEIISEIMNIEAETKFEKAESPLCNFCEFRDRGICEAETQKDFITKVSKYVPKKYS